ncbi:uncharacterized protein LOC110118116 isoform X2 [Ceratitis capitata]|uniref:(Mediterranean fruit fly) hypothetical protein n=1 Tax=Ceratitis capitata TaxID=7213 RepID=A0A811UB30_CERCA|nr:uncharacterized protein LOC110118116 isoform X2 [Ceratitis capitata]CAD6996094.1 unnamed protein product [Ceratitis capitata]
MRLSPSSHGYSTLRSIDLSAGDKSDVGKKLNTRQHTTLIFTLRDETFLLSKKGHSNIVPDTHSDGICTVTSMAATEMKFPLMEALTREVDDVGVFCYCNDYKAGLELVASRDTGVKKISHTSF